MVRISFLKGQSLDMDADDHILTYSRLCQAQLSSTHDEIHMAIPKNHFLQFQSFLYDPTGTISNEQLAQNIHVANYIDYYYHDYEHLKGWIALLKERDLLRYQKLPEELRFEVEKTPTINSIKQLFQQPNHDASVISALDALEIVGVYDTPSLFANVTTDEFEVLGQHIRSTYQTFVKNESISTWTDQRYPLARWIDILFRPLDEPSLQFVLDRLKRRLHKRRIHQQQQQAKTTFVTKKTRIRR